MKQLEEWPPPVRGVRPEPMRPNYDSSSPVSEPVGLDLTDPVTQHLHAFLLSVCGKYDYGTERWHCVSRPTAAQLQRHLQAAGDEPAGLLQPLALRTVAAHRAGAETLHVTPMRDPQGRPPTMILCYECYERGDRSGREGLANASRALEGLAVDPRAPSSRDETHVLGDLYRRRAGEARANLPGSSRRIF